MAPREDETALAANFFMPGSDDDSVHMVAKAMTGEDPVAPRSNLIGTESNANRAYGLAGALVPTYDPRLLLRCWQLSNILRPLTDVMVCNMVDGGWRLEETIEPDSDDGYEIIRTSMILQRESEAAKEGKPPPSNPTEQEIKDRINQLLEEQWRQKIKANCFLKSCNARKDFIDIVRSAAVDREAIGWGVIEVRRDSGNTPKRLDTDKSYTMRVLPLGCAVETDVVQWNTDISYHYEKDYVRYRRFVQYDEHTGKVIYLKEYGDPRIVSAEKNEEYSSIEELKAKEGPNALAATELVWLTQPNPEMESCGLVSHAGQVNSIVGSWKAELVNVLFFDNKAIPPMIITVSGGHLAKDCKEEINNTIRDKIKGTKNFHNIMILEAELSEAANSPSILNQAQGGQVKIGVKLLTEAFLKDQLFGNYNEFCRKTIRQSKRIPAILIGETERDNRATVDAALRYADAQVFGPERAYIERSFNRTFILDLGVTLWKLRFRPLFQVDPAQVIEAVSKLAEHVISPGEGRQILNQVLDYELARTDKPWAYMPVKQFLAQLAQRAQGIGTSSDQEIEVNQKLIDIITSP
jgi:PBSX family phage portal protein